MVRKVTVTFNDGSSHVYENVPENVTPAQVEQKATQQFGKQVVNIDGGRASKAPQAAPTAPDEDAITSGYAMGLKDPITAGAQMLPRGLEMLTSMGGNYPNVVSKFFGSEAARVDQMAQQDERQYQAARAAQGREGFDAQRMTGNIVNPANLAAGMRGAQLFTKAPAAQAAATGAFAGAMQPVTDTSEESFGEQKTMQAGTGAVLGPAGTLVATGAGRVLSPLVSQAEKTMRSLNVPLTPGQLLGRQGKNIEDFAQNLPLVGSFISNARERQLFQFNQGILNNTLRKVQEKLPEDVIGRDAVAYVQRIVGNKYDKVLENVSMTYDKGLSGRIGDVISKSRLTGAADKQKLNDELNKVIYSQVPVDDSIRGTVDGTLFKKIEASLNERISRYRKSTATSDLDIADSLQDALKIWRDELGSQNPKYAQELKRINAAYGDLTVVETAAAAGNATNGVFTPKNYQSAVRQRDQSRRKRSFAAGQARGQQVSDAAVDTLGPEGQSIMGGRVVAQAAGIYGAATNPYVAAGAVPVVYAMYSKTGLKTLEMLATKRPDIVRRIGEVFKKRAPREGSITAAEVMKEYQRQSSMEGAQ